MLSGPFSPWPSYSQEEAEAVSAVLLSNKVNYWTGNEGKKFEREFSKFFKIKYTSAIANASLGLECALKALNLGRGDEVIVPSKSYVSSASCVINVNAKPVFADIDLNSQNITTETIKKLINSKTKALIVVHLYGNPCQMDVITEICKKNKIHLIEDCAQAHFAKWNGKKVGTFGIAGTFSFFPGKNLGAYGDAGAIITDDDELALKMRKFSKNKFDSELLVI